jgi:hypothetical protein
LAFLPQGELDRGERDDGLTTEERDGLRKQVRELEQEREINVAELPLRHPFRLTPGVRHVTASVMRSIWLRRLSWGVVGAASGLRRQQKLVSMRFTRIVVRLTRRSASAFTQHGESVTVPRVRVVVPAKDDTLAGSWGVREA